ncbi:hypothetical protein IGI04_014896 [Brassica rapa subsp. trilocularis]|uniref:Uncharacterized protein n=1 Tax=Brassica rapa subsp. trilocularis TaxID=1813537 RepID=A0ABQ7MRY0_BRACM|nr:hypothetical protein IGI04_014896 [Brassica rapa subsp. trilocularis]
MHFMLEDFPRSLQEGFRSVVPKMSDFVRLIKRLLENSWKTLRRLPKKFSNAFYARRRSTKSIKVFCPKWYKYWICILFELNFGKLLRRPLEDSWKTLGRLLGKSSNVFYVRRLPIKSSGSLSKSSA